MTFPVGSIVRHVRTDEIAKVVPNSKSADFHGKVTVVFETADGRSWEDQPWEITPSKLELVSDGKDDDCA